MLASARTFQTWVPSKSLHHLRNSSERSAFPRSWTAALILLYSAIWIYFMSASICGSMAQTAGNRKIDFSLLATLRKYRRLIQQNRRLMPPSVASGILPVPQTRQKTLSTCG
jgi:hypothetical protein